MMKCTNGFIVVLAMFALQCTADAAPPPVTIEESTSGENALLVMNNGLVEVRINPRGYGRIEAIRHLPSRVDYLKQAKLEVYKDLLLPTITRDVPGGISDWLWGQMPNRPNPMPYEVLERRCSNDCAIVRLRGSWPPWQIDRTVTLRAESLGVDCDVKLTNLSDAPADLGYWFHTCPQVIKRDSVDQPVELLGETADWVNIPVIDTKRTKHTYGKLTGVFDTAPGIYFELPRNEGTSFAPADGWLARYDPNEKHALLITCKLDDLKPNGMFNVWHGGVAANYVSSAEIVFGKRVVKAGQSEHYRLRLVTVPDCGKIVAVGDGFVVSVPAGAPAEKVIRLHVIDAPRSALRVEMIDAKGRVGASRDIASSRAGDHIDVPLAGEASAAVKMRLQFPGSKPERAAVELVWPQGSL